MKNSALVVLFSLVLFACQSDEAKQKEMAGTYDVKIILNEKNQEFLDSKKELKNEIAKAQDEISTEIDKAREELSKEFDEGSKMGDALDHFVSGMGKFAEAMTEFGGKMGEFGINMGENFLENLEFEATLRDNGTIKVDKFGLRSIKSMRWDIRDGKMYLRASEDDNEMAFDIHRKNINTYELTNEEMTVTMRRLPDEK